MGEVRDFPLPDLGEGLEEGEIVAWLTEVGDRIDLNQALVEIETAKALVTIPAPFAGTVVERFAQSGDALQVGAVLCRIEVDSETEAFSGEPGEDEPRKAASDVDGRASAGVGEDSQPLVGYGHGWEAGADGRQRGAGTRARRGRSMRSDRTKNGSESTGTGQRPLAKPPVRKLAKDLGVDLSVMSPGRGSDGVITREDVYAAAAVESEPTSSVGSTKDAVAEITSGQGLTETRIGGLSTPGFRGRAPGEVEPVRGIRKRIVDKMEHSRREIPEASCSREADLTELVTLARQLTDHAQEQEVDVKITSFALVMRATLVGLRRFPTLNARFDRDAGEIRLLEPIHLGFAADSDRGLVVPNIKDAHTKSTLHLALELKSLAGQVRDGTIAPGDLTGGTFTVNNYGAFGNDDGNPIINHPEAGILGLGAIRERPWMFGGEVVPRSVATLRLVFDHRVCDGGEAGRFVTHVAELCEHPGRMLLRA